MESSKRPFRCPCWNRVIVRNIKDTKDTVCAVSGSNLNIQKTAKEGLDSMSGSTC